jgi:hypothetical protein
MSNITPIRVTGTFTPSGTQDVNIVSPDPLNVTIVAPISLISVSALAVGSATNVPDSTLTTIVTYTAIAATQITRIGVSGTDYAKFQLFKNTVLIETKRMSPERSLDFIFTNPLDLATSDVLEVKVTQYATGVLADYESTIYGV